jgi:hypothetical protein
MVSTAVYREDTKPNANIVKSGDEGIGVGWLV